MTAVDMFRELMKKGLITPTVEHADLRMPTAYRSVQTITTPGTVETTPAQAADAQLERGPQGDSGR
jgi:hypothetical protein